MLDMFFIGKFVIYDYSKVVGLIYYFDFLDYLGEVQKTLILEIIISM